MKIVYLLILMMLAGGCVVKTPVQDPGPAARQPGFGEWRRAGDREFAKMYWAGWHNAADHYEKALAVRNDAEIRKKLFFALLLRTVRDLRFGRRDRAALESAAALWPEPLPEPMGSWLAVTREVLENRFAEARCTRPFPPDYIAFLRRFDQLRSGLDRDYLQFLFVKALGPHVRDEAALNTIQKVLQRLKREFPDSNLNVDFRMEPDKSASHLDLFPDFIEIKLGLAEQAYKKGDFIRAEGLYRDVLAIHSLAPAAHSGLGSIRYWLELYDSAVPFYNAALAAEPTFVKASFGKAVCLHYLGDYPASSALFANMLGSQERYHGEAHYYLALNAYRLGKGEDEVIRHLRAADNYIPDAVELNVFAGIFHFHGGRMDRSGKRFQKVLKRKPQSGDAHYYLGLIRLKKKDYDMALKHFGIAADAFLAEIINLEKRLERVDSLRISAEQKNRSRVRLRQRIGEAGAERTKALETILNAYRSSSHETLRHISDVAARIRSRLENDS